VSRSAQPNPSLSSGRGSSAKGASKMRRVLAVHQHGGAWHALVAEATSPDGRKIRVLEASSGQRDIIDRLVEKHRPDSRIGVLASSQAVCRTVEIPEGHDAELGDAAALLAEAELPPVIPFHRRTGGVVPLVAGPGFRTAMLIGWPERGQDNGAEADCTGWTSEIVGLAELLMLARVSGVTGAQVIASVDRSRGCVGVVGSGPDSYSVRTVLEDASEPESFAAAAERCLASVAQRVQANALPSVGFRDGVLVIDPGARAGVASAIAGSRDDEAWFRTFGPALGVASACLRATEASRRLFELHPSPPSVARSLPERALLAMQRPPVAAAVLVIAFVLMLLLPVGASYGRLKLLESRLARVQEALGATQGGEEESLTLQQQLAVYAELNRSRWPMAKLLADLSSAFPAEALDDLTLLRQIDLRMPGGFQITGVADSLGLVNKAQDQIFQSNVFTSSPGRTQRIDGTDLVEFEISGRVISPYSVSPTRDYSQANLVEHIYNEEGAPIWRPGSPVITALNRATAPGARAGARVASSTNTTRAPAGSRPAGSAGSSGTTSGSQAAAPADGTEARTDRREVFQGGTRSGGAAEPEPVPAPLTDEEIAALSQSEAMREMVARRRVARQDGVDDETRRRLTEEETKLRERARAAQQGGG